MFKGKYIKHRSFFLRAASMILIITGIILIVSFTPVWVWMSVLGGLLIVIGLFIFMGWR